MIPRAFKAILSFTDVLLVLSLFGCSSNKATAPDKIQNVIKVPEQFHELFDQTETER